MAAVDELSATEEGASQARPRVAPSSNLRALATRAHCSWLLRRNDVVIVDVETTDLDGLVCEIAILNTYGNVVLDTLVNPGVPVAPAARDVHGIDEDALTAAPAWAQIWPAVRWALSDATVVAYNAPFDRASVERTCAAAGIDPATITTPRRWWCLMRARERVERRGSWVRLGGGHRARGDALAALGVMRELAL